MRRKLDGKLLVVITAISAIFGLLYFYISGFGLHWKPTEANLAFFILFVFSLCFLVYAPSKQTVDSKFWLCVDIVISILCAAAALYWLFNYATYAATRVGLPTRLDLIVGGFIIVVSLEITRRAMGNVLPILGLVFFLYLIFGRYMPAGLAHKGFSLRRCIEYIACGQGGIYGSITSTFASYIMPFMVFGAFLQKTGAGQFFVDISKALTGKMAGGSALICILTCCLFGMISGSPIACVMAIGAFTIPMMVKAGYDKESAGAICASAATGGQFMPPVMGAGAFILSTLTEVPYSTIIIMALVPALLYYFSLSLQAYFQAKKECYVPIEKEEEVDVKQVLKDGWYFIFVLVGCTVMIMLGFSIQRMAFLATVILILCAVIRKKDRFTLKKFYETCAQAGRDTLVVGATVGTLGIIMGAISLSGLGVKISAMLIKISGGSLFLTIVLIAVMATIVGMGLPTTASYIVLAILAAPALTQLGVQPVYAHLLCFWLCMTSNVTPPVCVAAIAAAGVSQGKPMKTGWKACIYSLYMYLLPFAFAYAPQITIVGFSFASVIECIFTWTVATVTLSASIQGWFLVKMNLPLRILLLGATVCMAFPIVWLDAIGLAATAIVVILCLIQNKKNKVIPAA